MSRLMTRGFWAVILALAFQFPSTVFAQAQKSPPRVVANENRTPAGALVNGTLELKLEITESEWHPEAESGPSLCMQVFAEEGKPPVNPGPMIRVTEGTEIHVSLHNRLRKAALVHGFDTRPAEGAAAIELAASATGDVRFRAGAPGTY